MKQIRKSVFGIALMLTLLIGCPGISVLATETSTESIVTIQVIHTNDIHGRSAYDARNKAIGFEKMAAYVKQQNADLVLDGGDLFHGQAVATMEQGGSIAELVKAVGYDAIVPGNHDWNYGQDQLKALGNQSGASLLAGNVTKDGADFFGNGGTLTKTVDGVKIGVLGVFDQDVKADTAPRNIQGLEFSNDAEKASDLAENLRTEGCEVVIALSHQLDCEAFISQTRGIDVLIAGHEHTVSNLEYPDADGANVRVVETGSYFQNVGNLTISYNTADDKIVSMEENLLNSQDAAALTSDPAVTQLLADITQRQQGKLSEVAGTTGFELDGRWESVRIQETGMGRLVTAAYLTETGADIAFENAGGIRLGRVISAGNITYRDVIDTAPFGNYIVTKQIPGSAVKAILEKSIEIGIQNKVSYDEWSSTGSDKVSWSGNNGSYLQFGGITAVYDPAKPMGERVLSATVKGEALQLDKAYLIATNNYISLGKEFSELGNVPELNQYGACDEALTRFIQLGQSTVDAAVSTPGIQQKEADKQEPADPPKPADPSKPAETPSPADPSKPADSEKPANPPKTEQKPKVDDSKQQQTVSSVKTGDETPMTATVWLLLASGAILCTWCASRTKKHRQREDR